MCKIIYKLEYMEVDYAFIDRKRKIESIVKNNGLKPLQSDIFDLSSFYFDERKNIIYWIDGFEKQIIFRKPEYSVEQHIRQINNI